MIGTRDPWTCGGCGASNPWMNGECRVCGEDRPAPVEGENEAPPHESQGAAPDAEAPESEVGDEVGESDPSPSRGQGGEEDPGGTEARDSGAPRDPASAAPPRLPLNIRWIAGGAIILALLVGGGEKWAESMLRSDEERAAVVDDALIKAERGQELTEPEKERVREALLDNSWMVPILIVMFLVFPFGIGVLVGYATGTLKDGAISVTAGMAGYFALIAHFFPILIIAGPFYAGVGALSSYIGKRLR